jgi:hypothetical protein
MFRTDFDLLLDRIRNIAWTVTCVLFTLTTGLMTFGLSILLMFK